jgi:hypothetical protein
MTRDVPDMTFVHYLLERKGLTQSQRLAWLMAENTHFGGRSPYNVACDEGIELVISYLQSFPYSE